MFQTVFAAEILYAPTIGVVKISTLFLFARIFPSQKFKRMLWAVGVFVSTYSTIMIVTMIFQCRPLNRVWDPTVKAKCIDTSKVWIVMASMNVLTDFLILCLPLPQLWRLQMRRETKLQVMGIFSIGSLLVPQSGLYIEPFFKSPLADFHELPPNSATVISIYRIPQLRGLSLSSYDPTWSDVEPALWSVVEVSTAMLGASAITYRPLFNWVFRIQSSTPEPIVPLRAAARNESGPSPSTDTKMQDLNSFKPTVPPSIRSSRMPAREDGFYRMQDSIDV